ncbi:MAG: radical SAM protein [Gammaproteobacteria bacterium]|nr:radical SAM protein [Gammaproteobacteria bacterium]
MCDIWRANANSRELSAEQIESHIDKLQKLGVRSVLLTGGEALMHSDLWRLCQVLHPLGARTTLLSTGLLLRKEREGIKQWIDEVIVSLDGDPETHDKIRNIPRAFERLAAGVQSLREYAPHIDISARCVLQRHNFRRFEAIVASARDLQLDSISFLAADVSSTAFNRPERWGEDKVSEISLSAEECDALERILEESFHRLNDEYASGFIAEQPRKMQQIVAHYRAINGTGSPVRQRCNAPWVSSVIEADGSVRPCFFHPELGNLRESSLPEILNSRRAIEFRKNLDVSVDPVCSGCTCTLNV